MINKVIFTENYEIFNKEIIKEIIDIYIQEYPERMENIEQNIKEKDLENLYKNAHSLKGVTANFFDKETEEIARNLETKGKNQDASGIEELFLQLKESSLKLIDELHDLKKEYN